MEGSNFQCKMKRVKIEMENEEVNGNDRISNLPKELVHYILCFLSTKDAVRTSILSKGWEYMWTSVPVLHFEEGAAKRKLFTYFVERVLVLHHMSLQKFYLSCSVQADAPHVNSWILAALRRNVKELHLILKGVRDSSVFLRCFFTCASITTLVLSMNWLAGLPKLICFPRLKILILKNVVFSDDNAAYQLFSGCPMLEKLSMQQCNWLNLDAVTISSSTIQTLEILENNMPNRNNTSSCQIMLYCESLKLFHYEGELKNEYSLCSVPSFIHARISILDFARKPRDIAYRLNKLLVGISIATSLTLSSASVKKSSSPHLPVFNNLTCFKSYRGELELDRGLVNLLNKFPRLESVIFVEGICMGEYNNSDGVLDVVYSGLWSNLKSIKVGHFKGSTRELYAVQKLLKTAPALEILGCI